MISRVLVGKKAGLDAEGQSILHDARELLGIDDLENVSVVQRYDISGASDSEIIQAIVEPAVDTVLTELPTSDAAFAVRYLPGQFDQRADSAAQCIQLVSQGERPTVQNSRIYLLQGQISDDGLEQLKRHIINPVDSAEVPVADAVAGPESAEAPEPVPTLVGFNQMTPAELDELRATHGLAMDTDDALFCQEYFRSEDREPTLTEVKVIDTYWSDHCRHTTFLTELTSVQFEDPRAEAAYQDYLAVREELGRSKPVTLMDLATVAAKYLRQTGKLDGLDVSEEINACTVKIDVDGEPWLLLFKNETHNHPTEIEPFGGAATCIGGAIRDPLSGRAYVYQAMRVTGAADPRQSVAETLPGKLPQRQIVNQAAAGYSSYGNQIGLATGQVTEVYHPGYVAKRMEIGAVVGAAPAANVRREEPAPGDQIVLLGGRTGRDGIGGATGSSKTHTASSVAKAGSEVQKGNAPEERKLQRLFRDPTAARLIKRCNDFGAGGISVAIGELAPGLSIDLDAPPLKYQGLSGTEVAISESQERMAVVLAPEDVEQFMELAAAENLEATSVAVVTEEPRLTMDFRGERIVDLARAFLDSNGAPKAAEAVVTKPGTVAFPFSSMSEVAADLNVASQRGLIERFDATIGTGSVLMPLGGKRQLTPTQVMAAKLPTATNVASVMSFGFNPYLTQADPFAGGYLAVVESLAKLAASGASLDDSYLSFQEYFERLHNNPDKWGKPLAALLGAYQAQRDFEVAAIGGKDSMSGSFEDLDVPPTIVSFAITTSDSASLISPEFKQVGSRIALLSPAVGDDGLPIASELRNLWQEVHSGIHQGAILSAWTPGMGGIAEGLLKMAVGNQIGFQLSVPESDLMRYDYGGMIIETTADSSLGIEIGTTTEEYGLEVTERVWSQTLEEVFPTRTASADDAVPRITFDSRATVSPGVRTAHPRFLIPVFPGTNCEIDTLNAVEMAGGVADTLVIRNLTPADVEQSAEQFASRLAQSQVLFLPGGFSGGDEPDGSAKLIAAFMRGAAASDQIMQLLDERGGLIGGICNGFQALVKLGLLPTGKITAPDADAPTLTHNLIGRHQSRLVRTRITSTLSPWLANTVAGDVFTVAISHGEGRLVAATRELHRLADAGQIATQYVDFDDQPSMDPDFNPAGSTWAIEGLTSPDGRVFGKMGHSERIGANLYRNVPGRFDMGMFKAAVDFFK